MEHHATFCKSAVLALSCFFCFSCVNELPFSNPDIGDIPVNLSTRVKLVDSPASESGFQENDAMGLYIIVNPSTVTDTRYVDNAKFTYSTASGFIPSKTIYYPEGNHKCDFYGYYPYRKSAMEKGKSTMEVSVETNQTEIDSYAASDFLVAKTTGLSATESPVDLLFEHTLCCINIFLEAGEGYSLETLLAADPQIEITDVHTKAVYDFSTGGFSSPGTPKNIIPGGTWRIEDGKLMGKTAIIVPQKFLKSHSLMTIILNERVFECILDKDYEFESGTAQDYTAIISSSSEAVKCNLNVSIMGWGDPRQDYIPVKEISSSISLADLNFAKSGVYNVFNKGEKVAEICKEYLLADNIKSQAIVAYPVKDGITDLESGLVMELIGEANEQHGGKTVWDKTANTLHYTEGTSSAIDHIYITADKEIVTERPANAIQLQLKPEVLTDVRGTESKTYPVVKIGTQYWMAANLQTVKYTNGSDIIKGKDFTTTKAQYCQNGAFSYFYNSACMATGMMEPEGWHVSSTTDWTLLKAYIADDASVLKNGSTWNESTYPVTNLTGFTASASGLYNGTYKSANQYAAFWCADDAKSDTMKKSILLSYKTNELEDGGNKDVLGLSVRCVRD